MCGCSGNCFSTMSIALHGLMIIHGSPLHVWTCYIIYYVYYILCIILLYMSWVDFIYDSQRKDNNEQHVLRANRKRSNHVMPPPHYTLGSTLIALGPVTVTSTVLAANLYQHNEFIPNITLLIQLDYLGEQGFCEPG